MRLLITGGSGFIGTNLMAHYLVKGIQPVNIDWNPPMDRAQAPYWRDVDLMDERALAAVVAEVRPTHVVHLAARTDTDEQHDLSAYIQNHEGTAILLRVLRDSPGLERVVVTSTQFVCEAGYQPRNDLDFKPFTLYGESKRLTEMATREAKLPCTWSLIRPTTIWGPWSLRYRDVLFKVMRKGLYFHPSRKRVIRSYGYVGNVVWQIDRILTMPADKVHERVFYVGDPPFDLKDWVEEVSHQLTGRPVRYIPAAIVKLLAMVGDLFKLVGLPFPITSGRFRSMTQDYVTPMDATIATLGEAPYDIRAGVREMVTWYDAGSASVPYPVRKVVAR